MKRALAIALLLLVASGATALALAEPPTQEPADSAEAARRATVYARFGDVTVTVGQIEDRLAAQTTFRRDRYADPERLREAADAIVDGALLAAEAERRGYAERPTVKRAYREALVQRFIREEFDEPFRVAEVSDADVAAYFDAHRDEFVVPDQVRASHILVATEAEARALIDRARGMDVRGRRQLARDHSLDSETKLSGGDLRVFARSGLPAGESGTPVHPAIVAAAFSLDERGEVFPRPVPVEDKFSVVMLTAKRPGTTRSVEDSAPAIRRLLNQERRRAAIERLVEDLAARVRPTKHPERLAPIEIAAPSQPAGLPPHPEHDRAGEHGHSH